ncbi:hypothetical protein ASE38_16935 [Cellulomonas sp. Root930]|nr:hypothetical protein ASE38_16935 [Cellulomonas sp. Root930]
MLARDAHALIGLLAIIEGEAMASQLDSHFMEHVARRFTSAGLTPDGAGDRELRQALNDLNHRLRYALGEYDDPPQPMPVP